MLRDRTLRVPEAQPPRDLFRQHQWRAVRRGRRGGTLKLLLYLTMSMILMIADHRGGYLDAVRGAAGLLAGPIYLVAASPGRLVSAVA
jgi:rod shape-determining protein MreC